MVGVGDREYQESCSPLLQILKAGGYGVHANVRSEPRDPPKGLDEFAVATSLPTLLNAPLLLQFSLDFNSGVQTIPLLICCDPLSILLPWRPSFYIRIHHQIWVGRTMFSNRGSHDVRKQYTGSRLKSKPDRSPIQSFYLPKPDSQLSN